MRAAAIAQPNIALIKYWGKRDIERNLPAVGSISITLQELFTEMQLELDTKLDADTLLLNGEIDAAMLPSRSNGKRVCTSISSTKPPCEATPGLMRWSMTSWTFLARGELRSGSGTSGWARARTTSGVTWLSSRLQVCAMRSSNGNSPGVAAGAVGFLLGYRSRRTLRRSESGPAIRRRDA